MGNAFLAWLTPSMRPVVYFSQTEPGWRFNTLSSPVKKLPYKIAAATDPGPGIP